MKRRGSAIWKGPLKEGRGLISTESKTLSDASYGFSSRFESGSGTNPEELIAAAHAGCFSMALAAELGKAGLQPEEIATHATVTMDKTDEGWRITGIRLDVRARVPNTPPEDFQKAAETAKVNCPVSALLKAPITMTAALE
jgi:lipoyl-dependent peroxiredoxin